MYVPARKGEGMRIFSSVVVLVCSLFAWGCGPSSHDSGSSGGGDGGAPCTEGQSMCDGNSFLTCQDGSFTVSEQCPVLCDGDQGCVECDPGANYCQDDAVYGCDEAGNDTGMVETCSGGLHCDHGDCVDMCEEATTNRSYVGCEYWPVDLDNAVEVAAAGPIDFFGCDLTMPGSKQVTNVDICYDAENDVRAGLCDPPNNACPSGFACAQPDSCILDAKTAPFAIVVSNPQVFPVTLTLTTDLGQMASMTVAAGAVLPIYPQELGSFPDRSVDQSGVRKAAYKVTSDAPIVAYQFNPLDNEGVFSNDGSLLIPRHAFDLKYYAMTWPTLERRDQPQSTHDYNGYVAVVAWQDDTQITITPSAGVRAGKNAFGAIAAGEAKTFTLDAYDVLSVEAVAGGDLSGTKIESADGQGTFGVLAGHEATVILNEGASCCADHLEEAMFPTSTWGTEYAVSRSQSRGMDEADVLRIMAQEDGTDVTFDPPVSGNDCTALAAGEFCTVDVMTDTVVSSPKPILVGHYLKSVIETGFFDSEGVGDPSLALAVPTAQFRDSYTFLVPQDYTSQYVSVTAQSDASVMLDGEEIGEGMTVFGGTWKGGRFEVGPGSHVLSCENGCGLEVYGYSDAVSYLFAGGLDLKQIVVD